MSELYKDKTIGLSDIISNMMLEPINGKKVPLVLIKNIEVQQAMVQIIFDEILKVVSEGGTVKVPSFGSFSSRDTRTNPRNPQTGETVSTKNPKRLKFSPTVKANKLLNN